MRRTTQEEIRMKAIRDIALHWVNRISGPAILSETDLNHALDALVDHMRYELEESMHIQVRTDDELEKIVRAEVRRQLKANQNKALRATRGKMQGEQRGAGA